MSLIERFLRYVKIDTQSQDGKETIPSTEKQWNLARMLEQELKDMGAHNVRVSDHCYVMADIPSNLKDKEVPALGFISHMDTAPDASGTNVNPRLIENYDGGIITLNEEKKMYLDPAEFESLKLHVGETLVVTDGNTLLGADDKAGVTEIMTMAEYLLNHPEIPHGKICIGFTPDEEIGNGPVEFNVEDFGAEFAYTVDGGDIGEIEYENFNGANCGVFVTGKSIHPGSAKNKMVNASLIAMEFNSLLPDWEIPEHTEGYEGFYHLHYMSGGVEEATLQYIIRDHFKDSFEKRKETVHKIGDYLNSKYGEGTVIVKTEDRYYNMKEKILPHMELIDYAQEALRKVSVEPQIIPIRGGTDGARLSFMGLPCPNLCTGGLNFHGPFEYTTVESMEKTAKMLVELIKIYTENQK